MFKTKKHPFLELFIQNIKYLAWSDPNPYDPNGNMIKSEFDQGNNGSIDEVWYYTYDANGNNTEIKVDSDNNGTINEVWYYKWENF